jgi:hypothetical protein
MNTLVQSGYYIVALVLVLWVLLWKMAGRDRRPTAVKLGLGLVVLAISLVPVNGLPLWRSIFAVWGNPSVPFVALATATLLQWRSGLMLLSAADRRVIWGFGAIVGTVLYFHPLLPGGWDLYALGWDERLFVGAVVIAAILLLARGQRVGAVLLLVLLAMVAGALESRNGWDYLVDPVFWLIGVGVTLKGAMTRLFRPRQSPSPAG